MRHVLAVFAAVLAAGAVSDGPAPAGQPPDTAAGVQVVQRERPPDADPPQGSPQYGGRHPPGGYPHGDPRQDQYFFDPYAYYYWSLGCPYYWNYGYLPPIGLPAAGYYGSDVSVFLLPPSGESRDAAQPGRIADPKSVAAGLRLIGQGDPQFIRRRYAEALDRYKQAAQTAPRLATAAFRQGWALIALGRYELAVEAFKRGLDIDPHWARSNFRLFELYGPNRKDKSAHIDALAQAAIDRPDNGDLLFLVGVFLFFDEQPGRAGPFFERAAALIPGDKAHLAGFLAKAGGGPL